MSRQSPVSEVMTTEVLTFAPEDNVQAAMHNVNASAYYRLPFTVADASAVDGITLRMKYDDGFQAYLNGVQVAGGNVPAVLTWNSGASEASSNAEAVVFESFSQSDGWDGTYKGKLLNPDVYVYEVRITFCDGTRVASDFPYRQGSVTLIR